MKPHVEQCDANWGIPSSENNPNIRAHSVINVAPKYKLHFVKRGHKIFSFPFKNSIRAYECVFVFALLEPFISVQLVSRYNKLDR